MDEQLAIVVESLIGHPSINALDLSGNHCRRLGLKSLSDYLARSDCSLVTLKLGDQFYKRLPVTSSTSTKSSERTQRFPMEELLPGLQANHSLTHLDLSRNQLTDVTPILTILWHCPHIQTLDLLGNRLTNFQALAGRRFVHQTRPSRLRRLELGYNYLWNNQQRHEGGKEEAAQWLVRLLEDHPELECFARTVSQSLWARPKASGDPCLSTKLMGPLTRQGLPILSSPLLFWKETSQSPKIQHLLDLNKTGRVLVANNRVPLAVWPRVLDRANRLLADDKARQATAVFHLLRGPMTLER
jgi:Leucine-rich repeat (LRR) protein